MNNTKENILNVALKLFAKSGFEAVSVSDISGELGITKGALYKHYKNKRDILDSIVAKMVEIDAERSCLHNVPKDSFEENPEPYADVSVENFKDFTVSQFGFWTENEFAADFRKMLLLEQFRNPSMAEFYRNCISEGPVDYTEKIFAAMAERGALKKCNPRLLALEFYSPLFLLIAISDGKRDKTPYLNELKEIIDNFFEKYKEN